MKQIAAQLGGEGDAELLVCLFDGNGRPVDFRRRAIAITGNEVECSICNCDSRPTRTRSRPGCASATPSASRARKSILASLHLSDLPPRVAGLRCCDRRRSQVDRSKLRDVHPEERYVRARKALGDSAETERAVTLLKQTAIAKPHRGLPIGGTRIRLLRSPRFGNYLPLRLYYWFDEDKDAVHLLYIDYDSDRLQ